MTIEQAKKKLAELPTSYQIGRRRAKEICEAGEINEWIGLDLSVISPEYERGFWDYANAWIEVNRAV